MNNHLPTKPRTSLIKAFAVCTIVLIALLLSSVFGVWWYTAGILARENILASQVLPNFELAHRFSAAAAELQSRGLQLQRAQTIEDVQARKRALENSISVATSLLDPRADTETENTTVLIDTFSQIRDLVEDLTQVRIQQLEAINQLHRASDANASRLGHLADAVQARVEQLTVSLLENSEALSDSTLSDNFSAQGPDVTLNALALFESTSLNIQDYLLFSQDILRMIAVIEQVPLLRSNEDVTVAEQQRDLLMKAMVSRAIYVSDEQSAELLLTPITSIRSTLRNSGNLFFARKAALALDARQLQLSAALSSLINTAPIVTEQIRSRSEAMLLSVSTETLISLERYRWFLFAVLVLSLLLLGTIGYWLLYRQTVRPLAEITAQLDNAGTPQFKDTVRHYFINEMDVLSRAVVSLDRTQKQMQQKDIQISASNSELRKANEELEQFAHVASHDLQEPLRKLQQFSGLLEEDYGSDLGDDGKFYIQAIAKSAKRMSMMIRDTLEYARTGRNHQSIDRVNLGSLVNELLPDMGLVVDESGAKVTVGTLPVVRANATGMSQLFRNLLLNALKYRCEAVKPRISVEARYPEQAQVVVIDVQDNGIGIDKKHLSRVFSPFERINVATVAGTGLGLAICYKVCAAHGWTIDVSSELGGGSCFHITIPLEAVLA